MQISRSKGGTSPEKRKGATRKLTQLHVPNKALEDLKTWLSPQVLQSELVQLEQGAHLSNLKKAQKAFSTKDCVAMVADEFHTVYQTASHGAALADTVLMVAQAADKLPHFLSDNAVLDNLSRFVNWQAGRHLLLIYHWYLEDGPNMADQLFDIHWQDGSTEIEAKHPIFAPLVDAIMKYIHGAIEAKPHQARAPTKKTKSNHISMTNESDDMAINAETLRSLRQVPCNLFGLYPTVKSTMHLLRPIKTNNISNNQNTIYKCAKKLFLDLLSDVLITDKFKDIDKCLNSENRKSGIGDAAKDLVRNRIICRGGILRSLVKVFGGDDGILACQCIKLILTSPAKFFHGTVTKDADLAALILADEDTTFKSFITWLEMHISTEPIVKTLVKDIANLVWKNNQALHTATVMPRNNAQALGTRTRKPGDKLSSKSKQTSKTRRPIVRDSLPNLPLTRMALIPQTLCMAQLGLLMREALNIRRGHNFGDQYLSRIMQGKHPMTGSTTLRNGNDLDQFMPIRWNNGHACLVKEHFSLDRMMTIDGLTNILIFMSTGQGFLTSDFVNSRPPPNKFFFTSLQECVDFFDATIRTTSNPKSFKKFKYDNLNVWGTPCSQFAVHIHRGDGSVSTTKEKFAPFFSSDVREKWMKWLGPLANKYPDSRDKLKSWQSAYDLVVGLGLSPFGSGVTPMQFANVMALLGLCLPPTAMEMARCINLSQIDPKGAIRGLEQLGFNIKSKPNEWVQAAIQCIYDHFDSDLTFADKYELGFLFGFGVMFVEHILCKIARYEALFPPTGHIFLTTIANGVSTLSEPFIPGGNLNDQTGQRFPISFTCPLELLDAAVAASKQG